MGIVVTHVTKHYGEFRALDDVSLDVPSGSLTALLGMNLMNNRRGSGNPKEVPR